MGIPQLGAQGDFCLDDWGFNWFLFFFGSGLDAQVRTADGKIQNTKREMPKRAKTQFHQVFFNLQTRIITVIIILIIKAEIDTRAGTY